MLDYEQTKQILFQVRGLHRKQLEKYTYIQFFHSSFDIFSGRSLKSNKISLHMSEYLSLSGKNPTLMSKSQLLCNYNIISNQYFHSHVVNVGLPTLCINSHLWSCFLGGAVYSARLASKVNDYRWWHVSSRQPRGGQTRPQ